jgi:hypothetical protein
MINVCAGSTPTEACDCSGRLIDVWVDATFICAAPVGSYYYLDQTNCDSATTDWGAAFDFVNCSGMPMTFYQNVASDGLITAHRPCGGSDIRLKKGVETLKDSLETLMKLDVVEYDWNENLNKSEYDYFKKNNNLHTIGLIAQNVRQYYPEVVELGSNGYYRIDYTKLNSVLVEAIKEQQLFIDDIDKELEFLESKLN